MLVPVIADYLSPKAQRRVDAGGWGAFVVQPIGAGETVAAFGGQCATRAQLDNAHSIGAMQIDDDLFLVSPIDAVSGETIGHSCAPNCGLAGGVLLIAMRDIAVGETLTFDHAMAMGSGAAGFECSCGAATCRRTVTGNDWMIPELQLAYRGYFSPYLAKRIGGLVRTGAERRAFAY